jgi:DNA-binding transcriptional ArsR family regulator
MVGIPTGAAGGLEVLVEGWGRGMKKKLKSNQHDYEREAAICKALGNPTRLRLLAMLEPCDCWSAELQGGLGISKANLSQHLGVLKSAGIVGTRRQGKQLYCGLAMPEVKQAMTLLRAMVKIQAR